MNKPIVVLIMLFVMFSMVGFSSTGLPSTTTPDYTISTHIWINQTVSKAENLVVDTDGHLTITNSTFTIDQDSDLQYSITINGVLELVNSSLVSNHNIDLIVANGGKIKLVNSLIDDIRILSSNDGTGTFDLFASSIEATDTEPLTLSSLRLTDSDMDLPEGLVSDDIFLSNIDNEIIDIKNSDDVTIRNSNIDEVSLELVYDSLIVDDCIITTLDILNGKTFILSDSNVDDLSVGIMKDLEISSSIVGGTLELDDVTRFSSWDTTYFMNLDCTRSVTLEDVTIDDITIQAGGVLKNLTADSLTVTSATTSTVDLYGWMHTTTVEGGVNTPFIDVQNSANVNIYRWITITVVDHKDNPISDAEVTVKDEFTDAIVVNGTTRDNGVVILPVLTGHMDDDSEQYEGYVQFNAMYNDKTSPDMSLSLTDDVSVDIKIDSVNKVSTPDDGFALPDWIWIVVVILVVVLLIAAGGWVYYQYFY